MGVIGLRDIVMWHAVISTPPGSRGAGSANCLEKPPSRTRRTLAAAPQMIHLLETSAKACANKGAIGIGDAMMKEYLQALGGNGLMPFSTSSAGTQWRSHRRLKASGPRLKHHEQHHERQIGGLNK